MDSTLDLLQKLSKRLSGRNDCRFKEYEVTIQKEGELSKVSLNPNVDVFPNSHRRKQSDKTSVLRWIFNDDVISGYAYEEYGTIVIKNASYSPGLYVYKLSVDNKRRKWIKM